MISFYKAVILDMDGVLTHTSILHHRAAQQLFDHFFKQQQAQQPPFSEVDYDQHLAGRTRYEGIRSFLASRNIALPEGTPKDSPTHNTIYGLGARKNQFFHQFLTQEGVHIFPDARQMLQYWQQRQVPLAVVSSSRNAPYLLDAGNIRRYFQVQLDGQQTEDRGLRGKPYPDAFLAAASELQIAPEEILVVEDAIAGVQAAKSGGFGTVVGVARKGDAPALQQAGADVIVQSLIELKS